MRLNIHLRGHEKNLDVAGGNVLSETKNIDGGLRRTGNRNGAVKTKSRGMIEAEISEALIKFEKEYMGRGPIETRTYIIEDMVIIRMKGVLTRAETQLTRSGGGLDLIKKVRIRLIEEARDMLAVILTEITGCACRSMHTDISTVTGERVIVFTMECDLEAKIKNA